MNSPAELLALYQDWRQLTGAETRAISAGAWEQVGQVQSAKALLQPAIRRLSSALKDRAVAMPEEISRLLAELISCERANQDMVNLHLAAARTERAALGESTSRLRDIRRAYVLNAR